ncbi:MAG: histidine phosphotransferase family protein [Ascidiaceihabitans sp.]|nr:histidine phosphotransferase family protein [Ascidiaceihabitans sp.]
MGQSDLNLAALIGSRICHDLISPIGAINNGLELLGMSGNQMDGPEFDLIGQSVMNASARIRFFRIAYGAPSEQPIGRAEVVSILNEVMDGTRLTVAWAPLDGQARSAVRMAFLAVQCLESAMPYGGRIEVTCENGRWVLHGKSDKFNMDETLWGDLKRRNVPQDVKAAQVQFALLTVSAQDLGRKVSVEETPTDLFLRF